MSVPHTGRLIARIYEHRCEFDGNRWTTPSQLISNLLNEATDTAPKTHSDIRELAEHVLKKVGMWDASGRLSAIIEWHGDTWDEELGPDDID